jgi:hypothetical protein
MKTDYGIQYAELVFWDHLQTFAACQQVVVFLQGIRMIGIPE